MRSASDI